jgi:hypothetical protein
VEELAVRRPIGLTQCRHREMERTLNVLKKGLAGVAAAAVAATALIGAGATPAFAASTGCTAPYWYKPWYRTCTTGTISANSKHEISISTSACKGSPWRVWDTGTGVTIASGTGTDSRKVGGLYGTYKAKLTDACWNDSITLRS